MSRTVLCTIVAKNYLAHARTLMQSVARYQPECERVVLLIDRVDGCFDPAAEGFSLRLSSDLAIPKNRLFHFKYSLLELATAVKAYLLESLLEAPGVGKVLFLDPDVLLFAGLDPVLEALERHPVVLTPHLTDPLEDGHTPGEHDFLRVGAYNLGFIGVARSAVGSAFLRWWQRRVYNDCVADSRVNLCVDQRWIDLVPGLFEGVAVLRDPGLNVAHWNLTHRRLERRGEAFWAGGRPLRFFHFSGYRADQPGVLCHYPQDRFTPSNLGLAGALYEIYRQRLLENGLLGCRSWPYAYGQWADGSPISDFCRRLVRDDPAFQGELEGAFDEASDRRIQAYLNAPWPEAGSGEVLISRLLGRIYQERVDVRQAFPDLRGRDRGAVARWFAGTGATEHGICPSLVEPVARSLERLAPEAGRGGEVAPRLGRLRGLVARLSARRGRTRAAD